MQKRAPAHRPIKMHSERIWNSPSLKSKVQKSTVSKLAEKLSEKVERATEVLNPSNVVSSCLPKCLL